MPCTIQVKHGWGLDAGGEVVEASGLSLVFAVLVDAAKGWRSKKLLGKPGPGPLGSSTINKNQNEPNGDDPEIFFRKIRT